MSFYGEMAGVADELLREFGAAAVLKTISQGAYDPSTGTSNVTESDIACFAAVFPIRQRDIDNHLIKQTDQTAYISVKTEIPEPITNYKFEWDRVVYTIIEPVKNLAPGQINVLYEVVIRK